MKEGYRFVDCDMHIMEPMDLFDKYLDPEFKPRVTSSVRRQDGGSTGMRGRPLWFFDGEPTSNDGNTSQYNRIRGPLVSKRANTTVNFAVERGYDAEAQVIGMAMEGIDIAVLFPTIGLSFMARDNMDPQFSAAICRAYNDWLHGFIQHSPDQLKMAAMLPVHDVNLACQELQRCVTDYGAVGAFVRPNYVNGRYWHSNYWDPLYSLLQDLNVPLCFHEGTGSYYSTIEPRFGENRFMRHVASHSTEMQLALIALMLGGILEFYPRLKVAFLEAQSWWVPGLLGRIEWDLRQHHDSDAPYLKLSPLEYWKRNCFSAIESGEARSARWSNCWAAPTTCVCRATSRILIRASPRSRTVCCRTQASPRTSPARSSRAGRASMALPKRISPRPKRPPSATTTSPAGPEHRRHSRKSGVPGAQVRAVAPGPPLARGRRGKLERRAMKYDLLIQHGEVIDPGAGLRGHARCRGQRRQDRRGGAGACREGGAAYDQRQGPPRDAGPHRYPRACLRQRPRHGRAHRPFLPLDRGHDAYATPAAPGRRPLPGCAQVIDQRGPHPHPRLCQSVGDRHCRHLARRRTVAFPLCRPRGLRPDDCRKPRPRDRGQAALRARAGVGIHDRAGQAGAPDGGDGRGAADDPHHQFADPACPTSSPR